VDKISFQKIGHVTYRVSTALKYVGRAKDNLVYLKSDGSTGKHVRYKQYELSLICT
jgi:hypothetical protein